MTPERWKKIDERAQSALELGGDERAAFINEACAGDDVLRRPVESQIAYQQQASGFLELPAFRSLAELLTDPTPKLNQWKDGRSAITESCVTGAGGMGEIYLAQDTTLSRRVAIKFLSQNSVAGERRQATPCQGSESSRGSSPSQHLQHLRD